MPKEDTQFKGKGLGTKSKQRPVSVMLPANINAIVRAMPDRSEFMRQAIIEKLQRENLLGGNEGDRATD